MVKLATDRKSGEEYAVKIMALPEPNAKAGDNENTRYLCAVVQPHEVLANSCSIPFSHTAATQPSSA